MSYLVINGGKKLHGTIATQPNKNSALAILFACLMIKGQTTLVDVPEIEDVRQVFKLLKSLGVGVTVVGKKVKIDASRKLDLKTMDAGAVSKLRVSLFFWGALAGREKNYRMPKSGGCHLGERTVRPHWYALEKLGVAIKSVGDYYEVKNVGLKASPSIVMYESGDTTTENIIMAAVLAPGVTTIKMASANYQVQDLCYFLVSAGAKIAGIGSTTLTITGVTSLKAVNNYPIMPDPIVAMTLLSAAIVTRSTLTVANCPLEFLELELEKLSVLGQKFVVKNKRPSQNGWFDVVDIQVTPSKLTALPDKIYGRPFPGLNIDNLPLFIPILTQAEGRTLVHDWAYENRAVYALELQKLGANITLLDPHRLWVEGPTTFEPNEIICPSALRPAVNVLLCMLAAKGKSILRNPHEIDRGYENLYAVLNKAGADIKLVSE